MIKRFFIYGLLGISMEIVFTGIGSLLSGDLGLDGFTNLWMLPIYGCAVFLEPIHDIIADWKWPIRGLLWVVIIWGMEYTSGFILKNTLGIHAWIYNGSLAIDSYIRLDFAPAWFLAGLLFERIHRILDKHQIA